MSDELRDRLYVFYERYNPANAVRVDEIARTYYGKEVELWTELSRKYGPEAVQRAAAEHQKRRTNARGRGGPPPPSAAAAPSSRRYDEPQSRSPRGYNGGGNQYPPQQQQHGGFSSASPPGVIIENNNKGFAPQAGGYNGGYQQQQQQQHQAPPRGDNLDPSMRYGNNNNNARANNGTNWGGPSPGRGPTSPMGGGGYQQQQPQQPQQQQRGGPAPRHQLPHQLPSRPYEPKGAVMPRRGFAVPPTQPTQTALLLVQQQQQQQQRGFNQPPVSNQPRSRPAAPSRPAPPPREQYQQQAPPPSSASSAVNSPIATTPVSVNAEVLSEISSTLALPGLYSGEEEKREKAQSSATHLAICARRALERLSKAGRDRVREGGGLLAILSLCDPWFSAASPGAKKRTAADTFILVDRRLIKALRCSLGTAMPETPEELEPSVSEVARTLERSESWKVAQREAERGRKAAVTAEEEVLRAVAKVMRENLPRAVEALLARLNMQLGAAKAATPTVFPYASGKVATLLFNTIQICNPELLVKDDRGRLDSKTRNSTLDRLAKIVSAGRHLPAMTPRQRGRCAEWLACMEKNARLRQETAKYIYKKMEAHAVAAVAAAADTDKKRRSPDEVAEEERSSKVARVDEVEVVEPVEKQPEEVLDLTNSPTRDNDANASMLALAASTVPTETADAYDPAAAASTAAAAATTGASTSQPAVQEAQPAVQEQQPVDVATSSVLKKPAKKSPRADGLSVRFSDDDALREPVVPTLSKKSPAVLAQQSLVLSRRMDRAIWDAFKSADFAPVESLLGHGAAPAYVRSAGGGETALMAAAFHGDEALCRRLLELGADPAATDRHGNTAAHLAKVRCHTDLATLLEGLNNKRQQPSSKREQANTADDKMVITSTTEEEPAIPASSPSKRRRLGDESHPRTLLTDGQGELAKSAAEAAEVEGLSATVECKTTSPPQKPCTTIPGFADPSPVANVTTIPGFADPTPPLGIKQIQQEKKTTTTTMLLAPTPEVREPAPEALWVLDGVASHQTTTTPAAS